MLAQTAAIPVTSQGKITAYFVPADEYEDFERFQAQRHSFVTVDLTEDEIGQISEVRMDPRHDHLNDLMDPE